ncbi:MAG TPA: hypothetical protein VIH96_02400, partial [Paraburkholderia sp.]
PEGLQGLASVSAHDAAAEQVSRSANVRAGRPPKQKRRTKPVVRRFSCTGEAGQGGDQKNA